MEDNKGKVSTMENGGGAIEGGVSRHHTGQIVYRGVRGQCDSAGQIVYRNAQKLRPFDSQQLFNHSPTGFEWGFQGSGPAQLALALLLDATGDPGAALKYHQDFKRCFVAGFEDEWELTQGEIIDWLNSKTRAPDDELKQAIKSYMGRPA